MELNQSTTKPSVRVNLSFTETEVIEALKCHAEKQGYRFAEGCKINVWESDRRSPHGSPTQLSVDTEGLVGGISKEKESE